MQPPVVMAFRKRLKRFGYEDINIKKIDDPESKGSYLVTAVEPLAHFTVKAEYTLVAMYNSFK